MFHSRAAMWPLLLVLLPQLVAGSIAGADDSDRVFTWTVTDGPIGPLGITQQDILINGQFPGPRIDCVTNDNLIINVVNRLSEPFLLTWDGIKQRKDGVAGTNLPIPPGANYTYKFQVRDQLAILVSLNRQPLDYVVVSTPNAPVKLTVVGTLYYTGATARAPDPLPPSPLVSVTLDPSPGAE